MPGSLYYGFSGDTAVAYALLPAAVDANGEVEATVDIAAGVGQGGDLFFIYQPEEDRDTPPPAESRRILIGGFNQTPAFSGWTADPDIAGAWRITALNAWAGVAVEFMIRIRHGIVSSGGGGGETPGGGGGETPAVPDAGAALVFGAADQATFGDPLIRPTLDSLRARARGIFSLRGIEVSERSPGRIVADALAGEMHELWGLVMNAGRQAHEATATGEWLSRLARAWLPDGRNPAVAAAGRLRVTADPAAAFNAPAGALFGRGDFSYVSTAMAAAAAGGETEIPVLCLFAGRAGNIAEGAAMDSIPAGAAAAVSLGVSGGADAETDDDLRARIFAVMRGPGVQGTRANFEAWATAAAGVDAAWAARAATGAVVVYVAARTDEIGVWAAPEAGEIAAAQVQVDENRPLATQASVQAVVPVEVDIVVGVTPSVALEAVESEIRLFFERTQRPGSALDYNSLLAAAIAADGVLALNSLQVGKKGEAAGTANLAAPAGNEIFVVGSVTDGD